MLINVEYLFYSISIYCIFCLFLYSSCTINIIPWINIRVANSSVFFGGKDVHELEILGDQGLFLSIPTFTGCH